jgi:hypothetical protein
MIDMYYAVKYATLVIDTLLAITGTVGMIAGWRGDASIFNFNLWWYVFTHTCQYQCSMLIVHSSATR